MFYLKILSMEMEAAAPSPILNPVMVTIIRPFVKTPKSVPTTRAAAETLGPKYVLTGLPKQKYSRYIHSPEKRAPKPMPKKTAWYVVSLITSSQIIFKFNISWSVPSLEDI